MDDPLLVRRRESLRDLPRILDRLADGGPAGREHVREGLALEQLLDDVGSAVVAPDVVDRGEVGMVEKPGGPGFLFESVEPVGTGGERRRQAL